MGFSLGKSLKSREFTARQLKNVTITMRLIGPQQGKTVINFSGSSYLGMVGGFDPIRAVAAGTEQIAQPVVREVPKPTSNPASRFSGLVRRGGR